MASFGLWYIDILPLLCDGHSNPATIQFTIRFNNFARLCCRLRCRWLL